MTSTLSRILLEKEEAEREFQGLILYVPRFNIEEILLRAASRDATDPGALGVGSDDDHTAFGDFLASIEVMFAHAPPNSEGCNLVITSNILSQMRFNRDPASFSEWTIIRFEYLHSGLLEAIKVLTHSIGIPTHSTGIMFLEKDGEILVYADCLTTMAGLGEMWVGQIFTRDDLNNEIKSYKELKDLMKFLDDENEV